MNYLSPIDRVEQLSRDYSDLKDSYVRLKQKFAQQTDIIRELNMRLEMMSGLLDKPHTPAKEEKDYVSDNWHLIRNDYRIRAHFKATKEARKRSKKLEKDLKEISDKYYSFLAKLHNQQYEGSNQQHF